LKAAAGYSGVPVRRLWALIAAGVLPIVRVPGMRAVLLLRDDLDRLLEQHRVAAHEDERRERS
jgi:excisionase family DNA binding protein